MVMRSPLNERLTNQGHYFNAGYEQKRFTPAGPDHAQIAAAQGVADYIDALDAHHFETPTDAANKGRRVHDLAQDHERECLQPLLDYLRARNDIRVLGPTDATRRAPTVAIAHKRAGEELAAELTQHKIMAGGGDFYATRLIEALGIDPTHGVLRLSFVHYTAPEDIQAVIKALDEVL